MCSDFTVFRFILTSLRCIALFLFCYPDIFFTIYSTGVLGGGRQKKKNIKKFFPLEDGCVGGVVSLQPLGANYAVHLQG